MFACVVAPIALAEPSIERFVVQLHAAFRAVGENAAGDENMAHRGCEALVDGYFDVIVMGRAALAERWDRYGGKERQSYLNAFNRRVMSDCVARARAYRGEAVSLLGVRGTGDDRLVVTRSAAEGAAGANIIWRLRRGGPREWRVIDVQAEGRSLVATAQAEFAAVLDRSDGDIEALVAFIRR